MNPKHPPGPPMTLGNIQNPAGGAHPNALFAKLEMLTAERP
jgi:hypothetical protein